ncbi:MAG: FtsK/SpoIIIE domain-containing protein [Phycisphaerales bacterium]|nr:FtsK/SpoIIIE domain-containing protein [Phycisphaerales bacterium]
MHERQHDRTMEEAASIWASKHTRLAEQADERRQIILDESDEIRTTAADAAKEAKWAAESDYEMSIDVTEQMLERSTKELDEATWRHADLLKKADACRTKLGMRAAVSSAQATAQDTDEPPGDEDQESTHTPESPSAAEVDRRLDQADQQLALIQGTRRKRLLAHMARTVAMLLPIAAGIAIGVLYEPRWYLIPIGVVVGLGVLTGINLMNRRTRRRLTVSAEALASEGLALARRRHRIARFRHTQNEATSRQSRDERHESMRADLSKRVELAGPRTQRRLEKLERILRDAVEAAKTKRRTAEEESTTQRDTLIAEANSQAEQDRRSLSESCDESIAAATDAHDSIWAEVAATWTEQHDRIQANLNRIADLQTNLAPNWPSWDADWSSKSFSNTFAGDIGIGRIRCPVHELSSSLPQDPRMKWAGPEILELPAAIDFQGRGSLVIESSDQSHAEGVAIMQALLARTLTTIPPGQVRLTLYDPIGLGQNFAGFMHLADCDDASILERTWTEPRHIESKLGDITEHMETVIQAYLRNEYDSLESYNRAAGQIAEPYHLLVLADFPEGITDNAAKRLASVLTSGPRCGVFTCLLIDPAKEMPPILEELDWESARVRLTKQDDGWRITQPSLSDFEFIPDHPPTDSALTTIVQHVGATASGAHRVEVPFGLITPPPSEQWTRSSTDELRVTLGQSGANRFQELRLGRGTTQHALVAGRTGSGKSTLLHVLITNMALWYSPDELEFHLIDFKKGVEFQTYAMHGLPHARVIAIESDREFGLSVLRRLDQELRRRGDLFRDVGVQDVAGWRSNGDEPMPRVLLIVDEFQEFFVDDDALAQEAGLLLDRLVRQGRAFGIHVLMGSQTLDGAFSLARSTLGQMGVRIALQCAEADSYLILSDENPAARLLRRPGEAIYNDAGGKIEGNSPFQVVWLDDTERDEALDAVAALDAARFPGIHRDQFVFKGNIPSLLHADDDINTLVAATDWPDPPHLDIALGDPIAIKSQTQLPLRARSGCNTLVVGQHPESGNAIMTACLLQAAASLPPTDAAEQPGLIAWIFDGTPSDALFAGRLARFASDLPHEVTRVTSKNIDAEMNRLSGILESRAEDDGSDRATILLLGLHPHRIAALRSAEDDYSFSAEESTAKPDKQFADILREGPLVGMHSVLWFDGLNNLNRGLSRSSQREFDLKVLFQMSGNDSGQLIDTTAAADLGANRAILHTDDVGTTEKFRPWAMPDDQWLAEVASKLSLRNQRAD